MEYETLKYKTMLEIQENLYATKAFQRKSYDNYFLIRGEWHSLIFLLSLSFPTDFLEQFHGL